MLQRFVPLASAAAAAAAIALPPEAAPLEDDLPPSPPLPPRDARLPSTAWRYEASRAGRSWSLGGSDNGGGEDTTTLLARFEALEAQVRRLTAGQDASGVHTTPTVGACCSSLGHSWPPPTVGPCGSSLAFSEGLTCSMNSTFGFNASATAAALAAALAAAPAAALAVASAAAAPPAAARAIDIAAAPDISAEPSTAPGSGARPAVVFETALLNPPTAAVAAAASGTAAAAAPTLVPQPALAAEPAINAPTAAAASAPASALESASAAAAAATAPAGVSVEARAEAVALEIPLSHEAETSAEHVAGADASGFASQSSKLGATVAVEKVAVALPIQESALYVHGRDETGARAGALENGGVVMKICGTVTSGGLADECAGASVAQVIYKEPLDKLPGVSGTNVVMGVAVEASPLLRAQVASLLDDSHVGQSVVSPDILSHTVLRPWEACRTSGVGAAWSVAPGSGLDVQRISDEWLGSSAPKAPRRPLGGSAGPLPPPCMTGGSIGDAGAEARASQLLLRSSPPLPAWESIVADSRRLPGDLLPSVANFSPRAWAPMQSLHTCFQSGYQPLPAQRLPEAKRSSSGVAIPPPPPPLTNVVHGAFEAHTWTTPPWAMPPSQLAAPLLASRGAASPPWDAWRPREPCVSWPREAGADGWPVAPAAPSASSGIRGGGAPAGGVIPWSAAGPPELAGADAGLLRAYEVYREQQLRLHAPGSGRE